MSEFSDLMSLYVKSKDIKTYTMAQYCDLDRSTMYKIINGKRNPSSEALVCKISEFMRLSPLEHAELMEAYHITLTGYEVYYRRKAVRDFFTSFSNSFNDFPELSMNQSQFTMPASVMPLEGRSEIDHAIYNAVMLEAQKNPGHLKLLLQPDDHFIMKLLTFASKEKASLKIDHILCLNNMETVTSSKKYYNLLCLKSIMPLYICSHNYNSYYYYDNIISHSSIFNLLPYLILTSDYAIALSADMELGVIYYDKSIIGFFNRMFQKYMSRTSLIGERIGSTVTDFKNLEYTKVGQAPGVSFQTEPCLAPMFNKDIINKYLRKTLISQEHFVDSFMAHIQKTMSLIKNNKTTCIFTVDGVISFLETGRLSEFPVDMYDPLSLDDRIYLISKLITVCKCYSYKMLKQNFGNPRSRLCVYANPQHSYLLFPSVNDDLIYLDLEEPSILHAFYDYLTNLGEDVFYSKEESVEILEHLIRKYRQEKMVV